MSLYTAAQPQTGQQQASLQQPYGYSQPGAQQSPWQSPLTQQPMPFMSGSQPQQFGQSQFGGQEFGQQPYGQQQPQFGGQSQLGQQQLGSQQPQLLQIVTELALRCAASAAGAVVEQLRIDPQALTGLQAQGQIPPHLYSNVLVECARRIAPVLHQALAPIMQGGQQGMPGGQGGQGGQQGMQSGQGGGQFPGQWFGMPQQQMQQQPFGMGQMSQPWQSAGGGQFGY